METSAPPLSTRRLLWLVLGLSGLYLAGFFLWYSGTPLGLRPVLDGKENLELAAQMAEGTLAVEPFYRAPLYPFLLSLPLRLGLPTEMLPMAARLFNALCQLLSVGLVTLISLRLWRSPGAALLSGLLVGLNPVLLHFAADPLDITLAVTWLLLGTHQALAAQESGRLRPAVLAGVFLVLGVYTRPHLLPVALACPLALLWKQNRPTVWKRALAALAPVLAGMGLFGAVNLARSGHFEVLPTQGGYNLWAANKPGSNGLYYVQRIDVSMVGDLKENPARREAALLYARETGLPAGENPAAESAYWRTKTLRAIAEKPGAWLDLMARKGLALIGNREPYNNKTYAFHKARSPWLRWNPLGWAVLLALGMAGAVCFSKKPGVRLLVFTGLAYAAGVLLFYASARFRVPLVPLLAVLAGGTVGAFATGSVSVCRRWVAFGLGAAVFALSLVNAFQPSGRDTTSEDCLLLAQAANELGHDAEALAWARRSYAISPTASGAELITLAQFNLWLTGSVPPPDRGQMLNLLPIAQTAAQTSRQARWTLGVMQIKLGQREAALTTWRSLLPPPPPASGDATAHDAAMMLLLCDPEGTRPLRSTTSISPLSYLIIRHDRGDALSPEEQAALDFLTAPVPTDMTPPGDDSTPAPVKNP
jgi:hypothetical protein